MITQPKPDPAVDEGEIRAAVSRANLPTLVMVLYQLTGDERWLKDPFAPSRNKGLSDNDDGGFDAGVREQVLSEATSAILAWHRGTPAAEPEPGPGLLGRMMSTAMGEEVPKEYEHMMGVEMGFLDPPAMPPERDYARDPADMSVVIVGAGVSGLVAALQMRELGVQVRVFEKEADVGGTWLTNRYPGAGVDTPSYLYSFSFFPKNWSTYFGKRDELASYMRETAEHFDLQSLITFETEVIGATWDDNSCRWTVTTEDSDGVQDELIADAVITAVGLFDRPKVPPIPGLEKFGGRVFHSAEWPEDVDLTDKRVAVVGTGASSMQIVPAVVDRVSSLVVFQRSPQWVAPAEKYFEPVEDEVHWLMQHVPYYHHWYRFRLAWTWNDKVHASLKVDPSWPHLDRSLNEVNEGHREYFSRYLNDELEGRPDLQSKAQPNYPPFGKRMLLDNGWYAALRRPEVELVTGPVVAITETGVRSASGEERDVDVIVLCTGFETHGYLAPMHIVGREGRSIREEWGVDDARAYMGLTTPGFPNLFFMYGPNTNSGGGGSFIFIAEAQVNYITSVLRQMLCQDIEVVECREEVNTLYNEQVDEAHEQLVWSHKGMSTYYRNPEGRVVLNSPWRVVDYWEMTRKAHLDDFITRRTRNQVDRDCPVSG